MSNPEELFARLKPLLPVEIDKLWIAYNGSSLNQKQDILLQLHSWHSMFFGSAQFETNTIFLPPSENIEDYDGEYPIGDVFYAGVPYFQYKRIGKKLLKENQNFQFCLDNKSLLNHTIIAGSTGTGKSNLISVLCLQLLKSEIKFLILDWKASYRNLLALPGTENLFVYTLGRRINPLTFNIWIPPKGTTISEWILFVIDILGNAYYSGLGVRDILLQAIKRVFQEKGFEYLRGEFIVPENPTYPTNYDILSEVFEIKTGLRSSEWKASALRIIQSLTFGAMAKVCNDNNGISVEDLFSHHAILELDSLSEADKIFIAQFLMLYRYRSLLRREGVREKLQHLIIIDEAHEVLKIPAVDAKENIIDVIWRNVRELGEGIIACVQNPSLISVSCLTNSFTIISFSLKSTQDIKQISGNLLLEKNQEHYIGLLHTGQTIVKTQGNYKKPFLITVSPLLIQKGTITDTLLSSIMKDRKRPISEEYVKKGEILPRNRSDTLNAEKTVEEKQILLDDNTHKQKETQTLQDIAEHPYSPVVDRYTRLGFSAFRGNQIINSLIEKGFIEKVDVVKERTRLALFELTKSGVSFLAKSGIDVQISLKHGKIEHRYYCHYIAKLLEDKGYAVLQECPLGKSFVDIVFFNSKNEKCAIEFETGKSDIDLNISNALKDGFTHIFIVAINATVKERILQKKYESKKLHILTLKEFGIVLKMLNDSQ